MCKETQLYRHAIEEQGTRRVIAVATTELTGRPEDLQEKSTNSEKGQDFPICAR